MPESAMVGAVRAQAARVPGRAAVVSGERVLTYAELERHAARRGLAGGSQGHPVGNASQRVETPDQMAILDEPPPGLKVNGNPAARGLF